MIAASTDEQQQEQLIEKYMLLPNQVWDDIITQVRHDIVGARGGFMLDANPFLFLVGVSQRGRLERPGGCEATRQYFEDQCACLQGTGTPFRRTAWQNLLGHAQCIQGKLF